MKIEDIEIGKKYQFFDMNCPGYLADKVVYKMGDYVEFQNNRGIRYKAYSVMREHVSIGQRIKKFLIG